jgi:hypothetical protein
VGRFLRRRRATTAGNGDVGSGRRTRRGGGISRGVYGIFGFLAVIVDLIVALLLIVGILFVVFKANPSNGIVSWVHDAAKWLAGPFDGMFTPKDHKLEIALNWGIALVVYVIVGRFIARLLRRRG